MARRQRRRFTEAEKIGIVKRHLVDGLAVSSLCEELGLKPTQFYQWQKQLFENGAMAFEHSTKGVKSGSVEARIVVLEAKLVRRNAVLAELLEHCLDCWLEKRNTEKG